MRATEKGSRSKTPREIAEIIAETVQSYSKRSEKDLEEVKKDVLLEISKQLDGLFIEVGDKVVFKGSPEEVWTVVAVDYGDGSIQITQDGINYSWGSSENFIALKTLRDPQYPKLLMEIYRSEQSELQKDENSTQ